MHYIHTLFADNAGTLLIYFVVLPFPYITVPSVRLKIGRYFVLGISQPFEMILAG